MKTEYLSDHQRFTSYSINERPFIVSLVLSCICMSSSFLAYCSGRWGHGDEHGAHSELVTIHAPRSGRADVHAGRPAPGEYIEY